MRLLELPTLTELSELTVPGAYPEGVAWIVHGGVLGVQPTPEGHALTYYELS